MHQLLTLALVPFLHLNAGPAPVQSSVPVVLVHPSPNPADSVDVVEQAAVAYTAYLTDLLSLTPTQQRQLAQPTRVQLRQLYQLQTAPAAGIDVNAAATTVAARYHRQLARVLTTSQYGNLVIFGGALEALHHRRNQEQVNAYWTRKALAASPTHYAVVEAQ